MLRREHEVGRFQFVIGVARGVVFCEDFVFDVVYQFNPTCGVGNGIAAEVIDHHARVNAAVRRAHVVGVIAKHEFGFCGACEYFFEAFLFVFDIVPTR